MSGLLTVLIGVVVVALICYVVFWALGQIPLPEPIRVVIVVVVALVLLVWIVQRFGGVLGV